MKRLLAAGFDQSVIRDRLISAWTEYSRNRSKLRVAWGPAKFFNEHDTGHWEDPRTWFWRDGEAPAPKRRYVTATTVEEIYLRGEYQPKVAAAGAGK